MVLGYLNKTLEAIGEAARNIIVSQINNFTLKISIPMKKAKFLRTFNIL